MKKKILITLSLSAILATSAIAGFKSNSTKNYTSTPSPTIKSNPGSGGYIPTPRPNPGSGGYIPTPEPKPGSGGYVPTPNPGSGGYVPTSRPNPGSGGYIPTPRPNPGSGGYIPTPPSQFSDLQTSIGENGYDTGENSGKDGLKNWRYAEGENSVDLILTDPTESPTPAPTATPSPNTATPTATPAPATSAPATPAPATPVPVTPAPATPVPATPVPATAAPTAIPAPSQIKLPEFKIIASAFLVISWWERTYSDGTVTKRDYATMPAQPKNAPNSCSGPSCGVVPW